jgi:hypothetical protein
MREIALAVVAVVVEGVERNSGFTGSWIGM